MSPSSNSKMAAFFRFGFRGKSKAAKQQQLEEEEQQARYHNYAPQAYPAPPAFEPAPMHSRHAHSRTANPRARTQSTAPRPSRRAYLDDEDEEDEEERHMNADVTDAIDDFFGVTVSRAERRDRREGTAHLIPKTPKARSRTTSTSAAEHGRSSRQRPTSIVAHGRSHAHRAPVPPSPAPPPVPSLYYSPRSSTSSRTTSSSAEDGARQNLDEFFGVAHRRSRADYVNQHAHRRDSRRESRHEYRMSAATASMLSPGVVAYDRRFSSNFVVTKPAYQ